MAQLPVIYSWRTVDFLYDDPKQREKDLFSGDLQPDNVIIFDTEFYKGTYYITTPRSLKGVPATLSTISNESDESGSYLLKPFPNWSWHNGSNCEGIFSPFRIKIDKLGRLWVADTGIINLFTGEGQLVCPPKLLAFDLNNNNFLITKYIFPIDQTIIDINNIVKTTATINLEVQILNDDGSDTFVYLADPFTKQMLVYSLAINNSHVIQHPTFLNVPAYTNYNYNGVEYNINDGLFSIAVDNSKDLVYYIALSSGYQNYVKGEILRKIELTDEDNEEFKRFCYQKEYHTSAEVITSNGILIFPFLETNSIHAWDTKVPFEPTNFLLIEQNNETLQFVSGLKITNDNTLLVTTNRLHNVHANRANERGAVNFRILEAPLDDILKNVNSASINSVSLCEEDIIDYLGY